MSLQINRLAVVSRSQRRPAFSYCPANSQEAPHLRSGLSPAREGFPAGPVISLTLVACPLVWWPIDELPDDRLSTLPTVNGDISIVIVAFAVRLFW